MLKEVDMRKAMILLLAGVICSQQIYAKESSETKPTGGLASTFTALFELETQYFWGVGGGVIVGEARVNNHNLCDISGLIGEVMYFDKSVWGFRFGYCRLYQVKQWLGTSGVSIVGGYYLNSPTPVGIDLNLTFINLTLILSSRADIKLSRPVYGIGFGERI